MDPNKKSFQGPDQNFFLQNHFPEGPLVPSKEVLNDPFLSAKSHQEVPRDPLGLGLGVVLMGPLNTDVLPSVVPFLNPFLAEGSPRPQKKVGTLILPSLEDLASVSGQDLVLRRPRELSPHGGDAELG